MSEDEGEDALRCAPNVAASTAGAAPDRAQRATNAPRVEGGVVKLDLCVAAPEGRGERRVVLVLERRDDTARVALCSNLIEAADDRSVILLAVQTGLPYDLLCMPQLSSKVWARQLSEPLGAVEASLVFEPSPSAKGTPIRGQSDPRWRWYQQEGDVLNALIAGRMRALLGRGGGAAVTAVET